ncbi:MAG: glycosyltransferase family 1 protein [Pseudomonadota bacterium]
MVISLEQIGRLGDSLRFGHLAHAYMGRPYRRDDRLRYAILFEPNRISYSQVFPFILYAPQIEEKFGVQLRFFNVDRIEQVRNFQADRVLLQTWFTRDPAFLGALFDKIRATNATTTAFLDSFAHNDIRLAAHLDANIAFYLKKSLFKDRGQYLKPTLGHAPLDDYYNRLYQLTDEEVHWPVPDGFVDKLRVSPNFFTAPGLYRYFLNTDIDGLLGRPRDIDVHARLGKRGSPWYVTMRNHAAETLEALPGLTIASKGTVKQRVFNAELARSKICFSPFGFGELCWRDIEATAFGSVLLKPSMDHLETLPDLYEADVSYVPCAWDFSDLGDRVAWILDNPQDAKTIVRTAFLRIRKYLQTNQFVDDMGFLFKE